MNTFYLDDTNYKVREDPYARAKYLRHAWSSIRAKAEAFRQNYIQEINEQRITRLFSGAA